MLGLTFSRWYLFAAAFLVQFCIGSLYAWSVLNHPIDEAVYGNATAGRAVNAFYIAVGVFGVATATMGPFIERFGPRWGVLIGTTAFIVGHVITAIGVHYKAIAWVYIGYGVVAGWGMGLCYISPVGTLQKWFPDYRGVAAGFAVGGYGAGSVVWSKVYLPMIDAMGLSAFFVVAGAIMSVVMYACGLILCVPPEDFSVNGLNMHGEVVDEQAVKLEEKLSTASPHEYKAVQTPTTEDDKEAAVTTTSPTQPKEMPLKKALLTPDYIFMYLMFFANQLFGVIVLSRLSGMCTDIFGKDADQASDIVSVNSVFNCCGRLAIPAISDFVVRSGKVERAFGRKAFYYFTLGAQVIVLATLPAVIRHQNYTLFVIEIFVLTTSYGGGFGTIPAFVMEMYGAYNIGTMHGIILTAMSIGGVAGGITFNNAYNSKVADGMSVSESYIGNIHVIFAIVCVGFAVLFLVRTNAKDRFEPGYHNSVCGKRVVSISPKNKEQEQEDKLPESAV